jgi:hypothetical protein
MATVTRSLPLSRYVRRRGRRIAPAGYTLHDSHSATSTQRGFARVRGWILERSGQRVRPVLLGSIDSNLRRIMLRRLKHLQKAVMHLYKHVHLLQEQNEELQSQIRERELN